MNDFVYIDIENCTRPGVAILDMQMSISRQAAILSKCAQPYDGDAILPAVCYSINEGRLPSQVTKYVGDVIFPAVYHNIIEGC